MSGQFPTPPNAKVGELRVLWHQEVDCCQDGDMQFLEVRTADGGGGNYLVLKAERWAIDPKDIDGFCDALKRFAELAGKGMFEE